MFYLTCIDVAHFDLKPDNILIKKPKNGTGKRIVKIADFGISQQVKTKYKWMDSVTDQKLV